MNSSGSTARNGSGSAVPYTSLCIIPVRGGSKGIPRKNLATFDGVSLLEWTIRQAMQVYELDHIFISTEDRELAEVAAQCYAQVIERPSELARDSSTTVSVVDHLLGEVDPHGETFASLTILQVTSPLRKVEDVRRAEEMLRTGNYDSVISAFHEDEAHPAKMYVIEGKYAVPIAPPMEFERRQDLPKIFRRNGAIFVCTRKLYDRTGRLWGGKMGIVEMPRRRSVDIDALEDLELARRILAEDFSGDEKYW